MEMSHNVVDFFATVGRKREPLKCTTFPLRINDDDPPFSAKDAWDNAITDLILLGNGDVLPDEESWIFLQTSLDGEMLEFPTIAFRKRKDSGRQDHITHIVFVAPGDNIPAGYELLRASVSGTGSGYLKPMGFLAFRRATTASTSLLMNDPIIIDIAVVKRSNREEIPEKYMAIERETGTMNPYASQDILYVTHTITSCGLCNLSYEAHLLDRYPEKNYKHLVLPEDALAAFMFPNGLRLELCDLNQYPLPSFFTFVFTDQDGKHLYVACLKFHELVSVDDLLPTFRSVWGENAELVIPEGKGVFCPKLICVLSRVPFYRAMRRYLRQLYSISLSSSICPLEHFICSVVGQVPVPVEGGRSFHLVLDSALISANSKPMTSIAFDVPPERFFPIMDLDFAGPLRSFSVDVLLCVFALMLREAKIVFVSKSNALLTETMETLRMLLFPLQWASCFVSRLPLTLTGLLQAPGGFMIGIHLDETVLGKPWPATVAASAEVSRRYIQSMHVHYPLLPGTYIVDLVSNSIHIYHGKHIDPLTNAQSDQIIKALPSGPKLRLRAKLGRIIEEFRIGPQLDSLEEIDSAFDFQAGSMTAAMGDEEPLPPRDWQRFPTLIVRDAFMSFMADILGEYRQFIIPPVEDLNADTYRTFREEFLVQEYLHNVDPHCRPVLELLMETQMFAVLLQMRSEGTSQALVFFEDASTLQQSLGLSVVASATHQPHTTGGATGMTTQNSSPVPQQSGSGSGHGVSELPYPLYQLMESEHRWACLNKVMQQHVLQQHYLQLQQQLQQQQPHNARGGAAAAVPKSYTLNYLSVNMLNNPLGRLGSSATGGNSASNHHHQISYYQQYHISVHAHTVQNPKLLELLHFMDFTYHVTSQPTTAKSDESGLMSPTMYNLARRELDRGEELQLHVSTLGPLLLPGPTLGKHLLAIAPASAYANSAAGAASDEPEYAYCFVYKAGWPQLAPALLGQVNVVVHPRVQSLRVQRNFTLHKVDATTKLLIRSPSERLMNTPMAGAAVVAGGSYTGVLQSMMSSSASSANTSAVNVAKSQALPSSIISAVLSVVSVSISMLSLRVTRGPRPLEDMLQILGEIALLESWGLLGHLVETTWRTILVACAASGGDAMRRISALLFKTVKQHTGLVPNALTYGQYIKAIGAKKAQRSTQLASQWWDGHYFLEELGFMWYTHKIRDSYGVDPGSPSGSALPAATSAAEASAAAAAAASAGSAKKRSRRRTKTGVPVIVSQLREERYVQDLEEPLRLRRGAGVLVTLRPSALTGCGHPTLLGVAPAADKADVAATSTNTSAADTVLSDPDVGNTSSEHAIAADRRLAQNYLQRRCDKMHDMAQKLQRRQSKIQAQVSSRMTHSTSYHALPHTPEKKPAHVATSQSDRSPMNFMSKVGGSFFSSNHHAASGHPQSNATSPVPAAASTSGKGTSPLPPGERATAAATAGVKKAGAAFSTLLSKGSSLFSMKSAATTPVPSTTVSPVRPPAAPVAATTAAPAASGVAAGLPPRAPHAAAGHEEIAHRAAEHGFDEDDKSNEDDDDDDADSNTNASSVHGADIDPMLSSVIVEHSQLDDMHLHTQLDDEDDLIIASPDTPPTAIMINEDRALLATTSDNAVVPTAADTAVDAVTESTAALTVDVTEAHPAAVTTVTAPVSASSQASTEEVELLTVDKVQDTLLNALRDYAGQQKRCLAVHGVCLCAQCGLSMMFEEVMALWCHGNAIDVHRPSTARLSVHRQTLNSDTGVMCPLCQTGLMPTLRVVEYRTSSAAESDELQCTWDEEVSLLSPFVLQFEMEELLLKVGALVNQADWLHRHHPAAYWNLLWYSAVFHVPSGLDYTGAQSVSPLNATNGSAEGSTFSLQRDYFFASQVKFPADDVHALSGSLVVGWQETATRRKAARLLQGLPGDYLDLRDVFACACSEEDFHVISDLVLSNLDGSPDGLRTALLCLSSCACVHAELALILGDSTSAAADAEDAAAAAPSTEEVEHRGLVKARLLYTKLLVLGVHFAHLLLFDRSKAGLLRDYAKEPSFDRIFVDCIKCVLSPNDLQTLGLTESALLACTSNHHANTVRAMLGILP